MKKRPSLLCLKLAAVPAALLLSFSLAAAADTDGAATWPQYHGPNRDNMSTETGLLKQWPDGGPKLIWKSADLGGGYAMPSIVDGKIFTSGDFDDYEMVMTLTTDGKLLWRTPNGASWNGPYPGARTTPTYNDGIVYQMNPTGRLAAFDATSGRTLWTVDLKAQFGARFGTWALAENVVVDGDRVFCTPGGPKALMVALDKKTGKTVWVNAELDEAAAYCSPLLVDYQGVRQLLTMTQKSLLSVDVQTGKLLWSHPHPTPNDQNITTPLFSDGHVFVASGHSGGGTLVKIHTDQRGVTELWARKDLDNCHGGVMLLGGSLYGSACRSGGKKFFCADLLSGETKQADRTLGKLSLTYADGMLYGLSNTGQMLLLAVKPGGFDVVSRFRVPMENTDEYLSHPVICDKRLYIRHGNDLYVYDVAAR